MPCYMLQQKRRMHLLNQFEKAIYALWRYNITRFIFLIPSLVFQLGGYIRFLFVLKKKLPVFTIVVGNVHVGGSGKTPFVEYLAQQLINKGYRIGIICKSYKVKKNLGTVVSCSGVYLASQLGDEAALLGKKIGCPIAAGPNRLKAAEALLKLHYVDILIFDDGLQYPGINYNLKIILYDFDKNLNGAILPGGPLRAKLTTMRNCDFIINTNCSSKSIIRKNSPILTHALSNEKKLISSFNSIYLAAGIANTNPVKLFIENLGVKVNELHISDHGTCPLSYLKEATEEQPIIVTRKDWVKLEEMTDINLLKHVWIIELQLEIDMYLNQRLLNMIDEKYQIF